MVASKSAGPVVAMGNGKLKGNVVRGASGKGKVLAPLAGAILGPGINAALHARAIACFNHPRAHAQRSLILQ